MNICEKLSSSRPAGKVTCGMFNGSNILPRKARLKKLGFYVLPDYFWEKVSKNEAKNILLDSYCFHIEDHERLLNEEVMFPLIEGYVDSFSDDSLFYTNCKSGFECISNSFLDVAILVEGEKGVLGIVCIEDNQQP
ncbi:MAG: hypothetical protein ABW104_12495 [Candidatus Thiodiazotropha sp. 6PLUC2]